MIENRPWLAVLSHLVLLVGVAVIVLPIWITLDASGRGFDASADPDVAG